LRSSDGTLQRQHLELLAEPIGDLLVSSRRRVLGLSRSTVLSGWTRAEALLAATVVVAATGLGLSYKAPDSKAFFACAAAVIGFAVGALLEPIKFHYWRQQERWRLAKDIYTGLLASLDETLHGIVAVERMIGVMPPETVSKKQADLEVAMQRFRDCSSQASVLDDDVASAIDTFQRRYNTIQDEAWSMLAERSREMQRLGTIDIPTKSAERTGTYDIVSRQVDRFREMGEEAEAVALGERLRGDMEKLNGEIEALLARQRAIIEETQQAAKRRNDVFVGGVPELREALAKQARRLLG
jgi:hypothetical protein